MNSLLDSLENVASSRVADMDAKIWRNQQKIAKVFDRHSHEMKEGYRYTGFPTYSHRQPTPKTLLEAAKDYLNATEETENISARDALHEAVEREES